MARGTLRVRIVGDDGPLRKSLDGAAGKVGGFAKAAAAAGAVAAAAFGAFAVTAVSAASDLNETLTKTQQVFGGASGQVVGFADEMADAFGLPKQEMLDAASNIGLVAKASGLAADDAATMSTEMAALAADASSFFNVPLPDALEKIRSGLVGEAEPLRAFGVLLSAAAVEEKALELGIASAGEELTEQQKVMARAAIITEQMGDASGDLERTQDGLANKLRAIRGRWDNFVAVIGGAVLPIATDLIDTFETGLIGAFDVVEKHVGGIMDAFGEDGLSGALAVVKDAFAGHFEGDLVPFFTETVVPWMATRGIDMVISLAEGIADSIPTIIDSMVDLIGRVVGFIGDVLPKLIEGGVDLVIALAQGVADAIPDIVDAIGVVLDAVIEILSGPALPTLIEAGVGLLVALAEGIVGAVGQLVDRLPVIITTIVETLADNLPAILAAGVAILTALVQGVADNVDAIVDAIFLLLPEIVSAIVTMAPQLVAAGVTIAIEVGKGLLQAIPSIAGAFIEGLGNFLGGNVGATLEKELKQQAEQAGVDLHVNLSGTQSGATTGMGGQMVMDHGGLFPPGASAVNLSGRPELVLDPAQTAAVMAGGGGTTVVNVYVSGSVVAERDLADSVANALASRRRRKGSLAGAI